MTYRDYAKGKISLAQVFGPHDPHLTIVGLRTAATGNGLINDGSDHYGSIVTSKEEQDSVRSEIEASAASVNDMMGYTEYGYGYKEGTPPVPDPQALAELDLFLQMCKAKHIPVIGFIPPMPHAIYYALEQHTNAQYGKTFRELPDILKKKEPVVSW